MDNKKALEVWELLGDIPINDDEEIDGNFLHFEKGTNMYDIWHWFEREFDVAVHELMNIK